MPVTQTILDSGTVHTSAAVTNTVTPDAGKLTILWASASAGQLFLISGTTGTGGFNTTWNNIANNNNTGDQELECWRAITASSAPGLISFKIRAVDAATDISWIVEQYSGVLTSLGSQGVIQSPTNTTISTSATSLSVAFAGFTTSGNATAYSATQSVASTEFTPGSGFTRDINTASTVPSALTVELNPVKSTGPFGTFSTGGRIVAIGLELASAPTVTAHFAHHRSLLGVGA